MIRLKTTIIKEYFHTCPIFKFPVLYIMDVGTPADGVSMDIHAAIPVNIKRKRGGYEESANSVSDICEKSMAVRMSDVRFVTQSVSTSITIKIIKYGMERIWGTDYWRYRTGST